MRLSAEGARVLGALMEKELTTPQQYPLTTASLVAACNQATNRDPIVDYDEHTVMSALDGLKALRLVRFVLPSSGRTAVRYRHVVEETLALDLPQRALVAVLLLRGPQTIGELRLRTDRMTEFDGLPEVERELGLLASLEDPLASRLGRRPGQKEERWACPLVTSTPGDPAPTPAEPGLALNDPAPNDPTPGERDRGPAGWSEREGSDGAHEVPPLPDNRLDALRSELAGLRTEVSQLRRDLDALRASLGE